MDLCQFGAGFVIYLIGLLAQSTNGKLVLINGNQIKDLTPAEPHEVDAFINALRHYAEETKRLRPERDENSGKANSNSSTTDLPAKNNSETLVVTTTSQNGFSYPNETSKLGPVNALEDGSSVGIPQMKLSGKVVEFTNNVHESLESLLNTFENNGSRPSIFMTDFAVVYSNEIDD